MLSLTIPAPCEALSSNQRLHHMVKAKRTAAWRARAHVAAIQAGKPSLERAHVRATVHRTDKRSYDAGNWYPTAKAILDGIVSAGCLPDDSNTYVVGPDMRPGEKADVFSLTITLDPDCTCVDCVERWSTEATFTLPCDACGEQTPDPQGCHHGRDLCPTCSDEDACKDCRREMRP